MTQHNFFCLLDFSTLVVNGSQAETFLQGQLTNDIRPLTPTQAGISAHCSVQGRVITQFITVPTATDNYELLLPHVMEELTQKQLSKYARFSKVTIKPTTEAQHYLGVYGKKFFELLNKILSLPTQPYGVTHDESGLGVLCLIPEQRYLVWGKKEAIQALQNQLPAEYQQPSTQWEYQNILEGIPTIYPETSGQFLPHHLNFPDLGIINFNKGCYTGQEIIARMHYRAQMKRKLYAIRLNSTSTSMQLPALNSQWRTAGEKSTLVEIVNAARDINEQVVMLAIMDIHEVEEKQDRFTFLTEEQECVEGRKVLV